MYYRVVRSSIISISSPRPAPTGHMSPRYAVCGIGPETSGAEAQGTPYGEYLPCFIGKEAATIKLILTR